MDAEPARCESPSRPRKHSIVLAPFRLIGWILSIAWHVVTLPIRLLVGLLGLVGRLTGVLFGFALMVMGIALWAGPFFILGIPLFLVGLLLTLRCLG